MENRNDDSGALITLIAIVVVTIVIGLIIFFGCDKDNTEGLASTIDMFKRGKH